METTKPATSLRFPLPMGERSGTTGTTSPVAGAGRTERAGNTGNGDHRYRQPLEWMRAESQRIQGALAALQPRLIAFAALEQLRRLTPEEMHQRRVLGWQCEQLGADLRALREEFQLMRLGRTGPS